VSNNLAFFEVASQVIPIIFIALLIEMGLRAPADREEPWLDQLQHLISLVAVFAVFVLGEAFALSVLKRGHGTESDATVVEVVLGVCALWLLVRVFLVQARAIGRLAGNVAEWAVTVGVIAAAVYVVVAAYT
jgi:hypothetical protein